MAISDGDVVRITCKWTFRSGDVQNVYHMRVDTTGPVDNEDFLDEIAADMDSMYDDVHTYIANDVTYDTIEVYNVTGEEYIGETDWPVKTVGAASGDVLPAQVSALALFNTATLRSQGRKFLPPMTESNTNAYGEVEATTLTAIASFIADVLLQKSGVNWTGHMGNYNYDLIRFAQWISGVARDIFATQRRRYAGSGS